MVKQTHRPLFIVGALVLLLSLSLFGLAACDIGSSSTVIGSVPTPAACGTITQAVTLQNPSQAQTAENCFWQAYQQCHPATLTYVVSGIDATTTHTFTLLHLPGGCHITDVSVSKVYSGDHTTTKTFTCSSMAQQSSGLVLRSCGTEGDLQIGG